MSLAQLRPRTDPRARASESILIALLSLLGVNAVWGTTGDQTLISGWLDRAAPVELWMAAIFVVMIVMGTPKSGLRMSESGMRLARWLSLFLAGVFVAESLYQQSLPFLGGSGVPIDDYADPLRFALHRLSFIAPAIPLLLFYGDRRSKAYSLRGDWSTRAKLPFGRSTTWRRVLVAVMITLLVVTIVMQAGVGFQPVTSGWLVQFLPAVLVAALVNSVAEETLFRGALQPVFVDQTGERRGVWLQAILFGMLHLGASPVPLDVLTTAGAATALGLLWGYGTLRTRGLGFAILTHMAADFTFFSVQYWPG